jgi:hypothetical protein
MTRGWLLLAAMLLMNPAWSQAARAEAMPSAGVSKFVMGTRLGYITCSDKYRSYLEKLELYSLVNEGQAQPRGTAPSDDEVSDCVHQTSLRGTSLYKDALKMAPSPKARAAYSEYMTAWESALKGIRKPERETVQQYRVRQKQTEDRLNALQAKLESASPG